MNRPLENEAFSQRVTGSIARTIAGSSAGTLIEWYDFFLYGAITSILAKTFFSGLSEELSYLFALLTFAAGFMVRPVGSILFGYFGDRWGRKNTFLSTLMLMGIATLSVAFIPSFAEIGIAAPILLVSARIVQGLAVGGEYGGAATYISEHSPSGRRGFTTSFIQLTCSMGLLLALAVVLALRMMFGDKAFEEGIWRGAFILSAALLVIAFWIRRKLDKSAMFKLRREEGTLSISPLVDSISSWTNIKALLLSTFCLTGGMTVIFYTSQFYVMTFMQKALQLDEKTSLQCMVAALICASPFFVIFGAISDRIGRRRIILTAFALAALGYFPLFHLLSGAVNPELVHAMQVTPITVSVIKGDCSFQLNLVANKNSSTFCDAARKELTDHGMQYETIYVSNHNDQYVMAGENMAFEVGDISIMLKEAGYPLSADHGKLRYGSIIGILTIMIVLVAAAYGPLAAMLAEMFPLAIRYTSLSTSYNLGVGWIGGLLPSISYSVAIATGGIYDGLWYPVGVAASAFILGVLFTKETKGNDIAR